MELSIPLSQTVCHRLRNSNHEINGIHVVYADVKATFKSSELLATSFKPPGVFDPESIIFHLISGQAGIPLFCVPD
jgi:hypothetical protein